MSSTRVYAPWSSKKRSRETEVALIESFTNSLDSFNSAQKRERRRRRRRLENEEDESKLRTKNVLAAKTLVKNIAKCANESAASTDNCNSAPIDRLVKALVEEYEPDFPTLTVGVVNDALSRMQGRDAPDRNDDELYPSSSQYNSNNGGDREAEANFVGKLGRYIARIDEEMNEYYEKIKAMRRARELQAKTQGGPAESLLTGKKQKATAAIKSPKNTQGNARSTKTSNCKTIPSPKRGSVGEQKRPTTYKVKNKPKNVLKDEIVSRYFRGKEQFFGNAPHGYVDELIDNTRRDLEMEHIQLKKSAVYRQIKMERRKMIMSNTDATCGKKSIDSVGKPSVDVLYSEIYARYASEKEIHGDKLPPGLLDTIIDETKQKLGMPDVKVMKGRIRSRFIRQNPTFPVNGVPSNEYSSVHLGGSGEDKKKYQLMLNEITKRYVAQKESCENKLLPYGAVNALIEDTKREFGLPDAK